MKNGISLKERFVKPVPGSVMKTSFIRIFAVLTAAGSIFLSQGGDVRPARAAVEHSVSVKAVSGPAEYAYESTGWKALERGKVLHAGASVRTGPGGTIIIAMEEPGSLLKVGPSSRLDLAKPAPTSERVAAVAAPLQAVDTAHGQGLAKNFARE